MTLDDEEASVLSMRMCTGEGSGHFPVLFAWQSGDMQNHNVLPCSWVYSEVCFAMNKTKRLMH